MKSLSGLRCFVEVARANSFALAARRLGLSTSAVSKAVARLETEVGVRLVNRTTRTVSLTSDGARVLEAAAGPLRELEALVEDLSPQGASATGTLRVSVPVAWGREWLTPRLPRFLAQHPHLRLELNQDDRAVDLVGERMDVAVRTGALADSQTLVARRLSSEPMLTCASPDYLLRRGRPHTPADLADHECLAHRTRLTDRAYPWRFLMDGTVERWPIAGQLEMDDGESVARAARLGLGISQMPLFLAHGPLACGELVEVLAPFRPPPMVHTVIYANRTLVSPRVRAFVDFLVEQALWTDVQR